jgi:hypothetical protein
MRNGMKLSEMVDYYFAKQPVGTVQKEDGSIRPFTKDDWFLLIEEVIAEIESGPMPPG